MIRKAQAAVGFCAKPDAACVGALLFSADTGLVSVQRARLVAALTEGDDLRLTRMEADAARRNPADVDAALRSRGFFPGRRVVLIEGAKDSLTEALRPVLTGLTPEDAFLIVTAGELKRSSGLLRLFEGSGALVAADLTLGPQDAAALAALYKAEGGTARVSDEAGAALVDFAREADAGSLRQFLRTLAFYTDGQAEVTAEDVRALTPETIETASDILVVAVIAGKKEEIGPLMVRLDASGVSHAGALSAVARHLRQMLTLAVNPSVRPYGSLARVLPEHARRWPLPRIEAAVRTVHAAELSLRSSGDRPDRALVERCLLRLASLVPARRD